jgi:two-component system, response regulator PdtaR
MDRHALSRKPVILVVEDEPFLRFYAADVLEEEGFVVAEAASAENALILLENRPDVNLVFTDIQMPGAFDGMALARRVHNRWPHIQVVITSGRKRPSPEEMLDARFIAKPYSRQDLLREIGGPDFLDGGVNDAS